MAFDETLAARVRQALARKKHIAEKRMFGGLAFLLHGNLLVCVRKDSLLLRLGFDEGDKALLEPGVKKFTSAGRVMKGWVVVASESIKDDDHSRSWIQLAAKFVGKLPTK